MTADKFAYLFAGVTLGWSVFQIWQHLPEENALSCYPFLSVMALFSATTLYISLPGTKIPE